MSSLLGIERTLMLIGLMGTAGVGKDAAAQYLVRHYDFRRVAFADKVRAVARGIDPYVEVLDGRHERLSSLLPPEDTSEAWSDVKQIPDVRRILQTVGTEGCRDNLGKDIWIEATLRGVVPGERVVVTDVRFANELDAIRLRGGYVIKVHRPGHAAVNGHASETEMADLGADFHLGNDSDLNALSRNVSLLYNALVTIEAGERSIEPFLEPPEWAL